uniref:Uncharacterized protein n=1 Tax=Setaria italica TaxID=4555 RepID=K4AHH4_SETIT
MPSLQLGLYTGGSRRRFHARSGGLSAAAAAKQLLSRLRSTWRRRVVRPRRAAVRFGYDLQSYCHNFDDGLASSDHRRL